MIYLDHSATSYPKAPGLGEAMTKALEFGNPGRSGYPISIDASRAIFDARVRLAEHLLCDEEKVIFTSGATESLNLAIKGLMKQGSRVISTDLEHNSVARPLEYGRQTEDWIWETLPAVGGAFPESLESALKNDRVELVVVNHTSNVSGEIQNLEAIHRICREKEVPLLVDVSQSVGIDDFKVGEGMALAGGGHKGLGGPTGVGFLALGEGVSPLPLMRGGTGSASEKIEMPEVFPDQLESGTPNLSGIHGLGKALEWLDSASLSVRKDALDQRREKLFLAFEALEKVEVIGPRKGGSAISVRTEGDMGIQAHLLWERHRIAVRVGLHCSPLSHRSLGTFPTGTIRVSPGPETPLEDLDRSIEAFSDIFS